MNRPVILPVFPDWPVYEAPVAQEYPVYISVPTTMARGSVNMTASVESQFGNSGCGCSRG